MLSCSASSKYSNIAYEALMRVETSMLYVADEKFAKFIDMFKEDEIRVSHRQ